METDIFLEIFSLNEQLFEFERIFQKRLSVQPEKVIFTTEGILIMDMFAKIYFLGKFKPFFNFNFKIKKNYGY